MSERRGSLRSLRDVAWIAVLAALFLAPASAQAPAVLSVTAVRFWSFGDVTRVAIEASGEFRFKYDRLSNPNRLYFDLFGARQALSRDLVHVIPVGDALIKQIRVSDTMREVTRVVLDLEREADYIVSQLANPDRLIVEVRAAKPEPVDENAPPAAPVSSVRAAEPPPPPTPKEVAVAMPAQRNRSGGRSLTRVLGLKMGRVVLDPGHGGHDTGSIGPSGLMEKDLVLDLAQRLGALVEQRLGAEVVYTRTDDTAVPLEDRTRLANERKADLFLSIHANSSRSSSISGIETFYLNFTTSRADLEVAARENAESQKSIHELSELVQKIALKDKVEESREFAARIQTALHKSAARSNPDARNRGVKKAPFVVLIGAAMPSVLVEIGFISNPREEKKMKDPSHRRDLAEALYSGVAGYASTLSHFQVARTNGE